MNLVPQSSTAVLGPWSPKQVAVMKQTIARDCNQEEFELLLQYSISKRLDPFVGQVVPTIFNKDDAKKRQMRIITTQSGQRVLAARCGDYRPAQPGDTKFTYTPQAIERKRLIDECAKIFNLNERNAKLAEINASMPIDPSNPSGLERCDTILYKGDKPVEGFALWSNKAPLRPSDDCYEWVEVPGQFWTNKDGSQGKQKQRRKLRQGVDPTRNMVLDESGQWGKMPEIMLHKCATVAALAAGWPDTFDGKFETEETIARDRIIDVTASEIIEAAEQERRTRLIGMGNDNMPYVNHEGNLKFLRSGLFASSMIERARNCTTLAELQTMRRQNEEGWNWFWANHKDDALEMKKELEDIEKRLKAAKTIETAT